MFEIVKTLSELPAKPAIIAPTIITGACHRRHAPLGDLLGHQVRRVAEAALLVLGEERAVLVDPIGEDLPLGGSRLGTLRLRHPAGVCDRRGSE